MAEEDDTEKPHAATAKQRQRFVNAGDIPRSRDLTAAVLVAASMVLMVWLGHAHAGRLIAYIRGLMLEVHQPISGRLFVQSLSVFWYITGPFFAVSILVTVMMALVQNGGTLPIRELTFKPPLLNFFPALLKFFALKQNLLSVSLSVAKMAFLGVICMGVFADQLPQLVGHVPASLFDGFRISLELLNPLLKRGIGTLFVIGVVDFAISRYRVENRMRMTAQQMRDENRELNGDGRIRSRQRAMHAKLVQQRSMQDVPKADVILVNPTHYAVALAYDSETMDAPKVLAKGADLWAERIRSIARRHSIPVISQPALTRLLYRQVDAGADIPQEVYQAVALILAHVYRIRRGEN